MRILLVNPEIRSWARPNCVPLGLGYVAGALTRAGHHVELLDLNATRQPIDVIEGYDYDVLGTGGIITTFAQVKQICEESSRHHPGAITIVGGPMGASVPDLVRLFADVAYAGDGEALPDKMMTSNGCFWHGDIGDLSNLPRIPWDLFHLNTYLHAPIGHQNKRKWIDGGDDAEASVNLSATRGCPYKCRYCYHDYMGSKYRRRPVPDIIDEITRLRDTYGVKYVHFVDDEFMISRGFVREFCNAVESLGITWGCTGRANLVDRPILHQMRSAGCRQIAYGIESGSQRMLDAMDKRVNVQDAMNALFYTREIIGDAAYTLMLGYPGEDYDSIGETVDFVEEYGSRPEAVFYCTPYPGTRLFRDVQEDLGNIWDYVMRLGEQGGQIAHNCSKLRDSTLIEAKKLLEGI